MDCVTECPDTAILGKVLSETEFEEKLKTIPEADRDMFRKQWSKTKKYYDAGKKKAGAAACSTSSSIPPSARAVPSASRSATTTPSR